MLRIGITGQFGFVGTHLHNYLGLKDDVEQIPFQKLFFEDKILLQNFVKQCDVVVHLAAMNRHSDVNVLYQTNITLVQSLIEAMESEDVTPHIIFSSSTQEDGNNCYGNSKKEGRELFGFWAEKTGATFTGLVIPNVFGPFGKPYYNSVVATFCYQLTHNEEPKIVEDATVKLIYVDELTAEIWRLIQDKKSAPCHYLPATSEIKVANILALLNEYKSQYFEKNVFPVFNNHFELNLFNTFRSYIDHLAHYPVILKKNTDSRGSFVEIVKTLTGGQFSFSTTHKKITRGDHFHTRKIERFVVISGKAVIELRRIGTKEILHFEINGENPSFVDMPIWYTHNITNVGTEDLFTLFWINEFFDPEDPDTFFEKVTYDINQPRVI